MAVDAEMETMLEHDRAALSQTLGQQISTSQYLRIALTERLARAQGGQSTLGGSGWEAGYKDGFRKGLEDFYTKVRSFAANTVVPPADVDAEG